MAILAHLNSVYEILEGESIDWPGGAVATTTSGDLNPYSEEGIQLRNWTTPVVPFYSNASDIWIAFHYKRAVLGSDSDFYFRDESGTNIYRLTMVNQSTTTYFQIWDGSTWTTLATFSIGTTVARYDVHIVRAQSGGVVEIYRDGLLIDSYTGDTQRISGSDFMSSFYISHERDAYLSGFFIADEDTRAMEYVELRPGGYGTYIEWDGSHTDVDGYGLDDSNYIQTYNNAKKMTFVLDTITTDFDANYDVVAVGVTCRATKGTDATEGLKLMVKSATGEAQGSLETLSTGKLPYRALFTTNPDTAAAWTVAEVKNAEIGVEAI